MLHYVASTKVETLKPQFSRVVCCPQWLVVIFTCDVSHLHTLTSPSVAYWSYYIINLFPLTFNNPHLDPDKIDRQKLGISSGTDYIYTYTYVCIYIRYHVIHMYIYIYLYIGSVLWLGAAVCVTAPHIFTGQGTKIWAASETRSSKFCSSPRRRWSIEWCLGSNDDM